MWTRIRRSNYLEAEGQGAQGVKQTERFRPALLAIRLAAPKRFVSAYGICRAGSFHWLGT